MFNTIMVGAVASIGGALVASIWRNYRKDVKATLVSIPARVESKLHVDIPEGVENVYGSLIASAVSAMDSSFGNRRFWGNIIKALRGKNTNFVADEFLSVFKDVDWAKSLTDQVPASVLKIFNDIRLELATNHVIDGATLLKAISPGSVQTEVIETLVAKETVTPLIEAAIRMNNVSLKQAPAKETGQDGADNVKYVITELIAESKKRQRALRAN